MSPERVSVVPHIHGRHVRELVVRDGEEALAGAEGLIGLAERGDVDQQRVVGRGACAGIAVIGKIFQQQRRALPRTPAENALLESQ